MHFFLVVLHKAKVLAQNNQVIGDLEQGQHALMTAIHSKTVEAHTNFVTSDRNNLPCDLSSFSSSVILWAFSLARFLA